MNDEKTQKMNNIAVI